MQRGAVAVQVLDEGDDSTVVAEVVALGAALVRDLDTNSRIEKGKFAQPLGEGFEGEFDRGKYFGIGVECHPGARVVGGPDLFQRALGFAALVRLSPDLPVTANFQLQIAGEGVDHRNAYTVQTPGNLVALFVELSAGVQGRHHHLGRGAFFDRVFVYGNTAPVINDRHAVVRMDLHDDFLAVARKRLIDRVVCDLVDQVVQTID